MFMPDTVDSITAQFSKAVTRLQALAEKREAARAYNLQLAKEFSDAAEIHGKEAARGRVIAAKINKLLSDE